MQNNNFFANNNNFNEYYERPPSEDLIKNKKFQDRSYLQKNRKIYNNINNYKRDIYKNKNYNHLENYVPHNFTDEKYGRENNSNLIMCKLDLLDNINYVNKQNECKLDNLRNIYNSNTSEISENSNKSLILSHDKYPSLIKKTDETLSTLENSGKKKEIEKNKILFKNKNIQSRNENINKLLNKNCLDKIFEGKSYKKFEDKNDNFSINEEQVEFCFNDWEEIKETNKKLRQELDLKKRTLKYYNKTKNFSFEETQSFLKRKNNILKQKKIEDLRKKKKILLEKIDLQKKYSKKNQLKSLNINEKNIKFYFTKIKDNLEESLNFLKVSEIKQKDLNKNYELNNPKIKKYLNFFIEKKKENKILKQKIKEFKGFFSQDYYDELEKTKIKAKRLKEKLTDLKKINSKLKKNQK